MLNKKSEVYFHLSSQENFEHHIESLMYWVQEYLPDWYGY